MKQVIRMSTVVCVLMLSGAMACKDDPAGPTGLNIELISNTTFEYTSIFNTSGWKIVGMTAKGNNATPGTGGAWSLELDAQPGATTYAETVVSGASTGTGTYTLTAFMANLPVEGVIGIGKRTGGVTTISASTTSDSAGWHKVTVTGDITFAAGDSLVARLSAGTGSTDKFVLYDLVSFMRTK